MSNTQARCLHGFVQSTLARRAARSRPRVSSTPSSTANLGVCFHKGLGASGVSSLGDDFTRRLNEYSSFSADIDTKAFTKVSKCKAAGCSNLGWIANGICDATCNVKDCDYDGGDCIADPGMLT